MTYMKGRKSTRPIEPSLRKIRTKVTIISVVSTLTTTVQYIKKHFYEVLSSKLFNNLCCSRIPSPLRGGGGWKGPTMHL